MSGERSSRDISEALSAVDLMGIKNLQEALSIRGQPGKFTPQTVDEMRFNAPEWVLNSLVLGEIISEEFLQHCRSAGEGDDAGKIIDVLNALTEKALQSTDGKLESADALVSMELTGGIPGEDEFARSAVFENALYKYKLAKQGADEEGADLAFSELQSAFEKKYGLSFEDADYIIAASITKDYERIVNLQESLLPFSPNAQALVISCVYDPAKRTRLSRVEAEDIVALLEYKNVSQVLTQEEMAILQMARLILGQGVIRTLVRHAVNAVQTLSGNRPPLEYSSLARKNDEASPEVSQSAL